MSLAAVDAILAVQKRLDRLVRGLTSPPNASRLLEPPALAVAVDPLVHLSLSVSGPPGVPATVGGTGSGVPYEDDNAPPEQVQDGTHGWPGNPEITPWPKTSRTTGRTLADAEQSPVPAPVRVPAPGPAVALPPTPEAVPPQVQEIAVRPSVRAERVEQSPLPAPVRVPAPGPAVALPPTPVAVPLQVQEIVRPAVRAEKAEAAPAEHPGSAVFRPHPVAAAPVAISEVPVPQIRPPSGHAPQGRTPQPTTRRGERRHSPDVRAVPAPALDDPEQSDEKAFQVTRDPVRGAAILRAHLGGASASDVAGGPHARPGDDEPTASPHIGHKLRPAHPGVRLISAPAAVPDATDVQSTPDLHSALERHGAPAAHAGIGQDTTGAALDDLYAALADRLRLDVLRTYGTGQG